MENWLRYFEHNRRHQLRIPWDSPVEIEPRLRRPLIRSLQRFQVGESGEGNHLRARAAKTQDPTYQAAIELFIREEQEHARLMARILERLKAPLLRCHWSDGCFIFLRRLFGLHEELLVLLIPEMIAKRYFLALRDGLKGPIFGAVFSQILHDEDGHLGFHVDYLQQALAALSLPARWLVRCLWRLVFRAACLVVIVDHRAILRGVGVSMAAFWWDCGCIFDEAAAAIFCCATTPVLGRGGLGLKTDRESPSLVAGG